MIGSRRVASNTTGAATLLLRTVPHTTVDGAAVDTCGLQPVTPAVTADVATTAARALMLDFQRHLIPVRRGAEHSGFRLLSPVVLFFSVILAGAKVRGSGRRVNCRRSRSRATARNGRH